MTTRRSMTVPKAWLKDLSVRIATRVMDKQALARVQSGLGFISSGVPDAAFNAESAEALLADHPGEPSMTAIRTFLLEWWSKNAPEDPTGMPRDIADSGLERTDQGWCRLFRRASAMEASNTLNLVRTQAPAAFRWLVENDTDAFRLAKRRGWSAGTEQRGTEWGDPNVVRRAVDACYGAAEDGTQSWPTDQEIASGLSLLSALVARWAPHNLELIPVHQVGEQRVERSEWVAPRPVPSLMTADQLQNAYKDRGLADPRRARAA